MAEYRAKQLEEAIQILKCGDSVPNIPTLLEALYDSLYPTKYSTSRSGRLTRKEDFEDFSDLIFEFCIELVKKYYKLVHGVDLVIEESNKSVNGMATGAYDPKTDKIYYNPTIMEISKRSNTGLCQSFLHEARHKYQCDAFKVSDIDELLELDPSMILIAKEYAFVNTQDMGFLLDNYVNLYQELDAEATSIEMLGRMVTRILDVYKDYCKDHKQIDILDICYRYGVVERLVASDAVTFYHKDVHRGWLSPCLMSELRGKAQISSSYIINGEKVDRLVTMDKHLKANPELRDKYPILKIIINDDLTMKSYDQIISERDRLIQEKGEDKTKKIMDLYNIIIVSDPILYLTSLVEKNDVSSVEKFMNYHKDIRNEYPEEMKAIVERTTNPIMRDKLNGVKKMSFI